MEPGKEPERQQAVEPCEAMDDAQDTGAASSGQQNLDMHEAPVEPVRTYLKPTHRVTGKNSPSSGVRVRTPPKRGAPDGELSPSGRDEPGSSAKRRSPHSPGGTDNASMEL